MTPVRILVYARGGLADCLRAVPFVRALRTAYPEARITVLGDRVGRDIWERCPYCNDFLEELPEAGRQAKRPRLAKVVAAWAAARRLRGRYDVMVNLAVQPGGRLPALVGVLAGIRRRVGHGDLRHGVSVSAGPVDLRVPYEDRALQILRTLGVEPEDLSLEAWHSAAEGASAEALLRRHGWSSDRRLVVCHPGSDWSCQTWPARRWAHLAAALSERGALAVFTGTHDQAGLVAEIAAAGGRPVADLTGSTDLGELCAVLGRADLVITVDTVIAPIARALGREVITLAAYDTSNWGLERARELRVLRKHVPSEQVPWSVACHWHRSGVLPGCTSRSCVGIHGMGAIDVDHVLEAASEVPAWRA